MLETHRSRVIAMRAITAIVLIPIALFAPILTFGVKIFDMRGLRGSGLIYYLQWATYLGWFITVVIVVSYLVWLLMELVPNWARYGTRDPELMKYIDDLKEVIQRQSDIFDQREKKLRTLKAQLRVEKLKRRKLKKRLREFNDPQSTSGYQQPPTPH